MIIKDKEQYLIISQINVYYIITINTIYLKVTIQLCCMILVYKNTVQ